MSSGTTNVNLPSLPSFRPCVERDQRSSVPKWATSYLIPLGRPSPPSVTEVKPVELHSRLIYKGHSSSHRPGIDDFLSNHHLNSCVLHRTSAEYSYKFSTHTTSGCVWVLREEPFFRPSPTRDPSGFTSLPSPFPYPFLHDDFVVSPFATHIFPVSVSKIPVTRPFLSTSSTTRSVYYLPQSRRLPLPQGAPHFFSLLFRGLLF